MSFTISVHIIKDSLDFEIQVHIQIMCRDFIFEDDLNVINFEVDDLISLRGDGQQNFFLCA